MGSLRHPRWTFEKGLHELAGGTWAWLQPDGSWGWSNAGLVTDGDASLLVDTLFDVPLTQAMLDAMRDATSAADRIDVLVNTHANGDHCFGNELVDGAVIVASKACAEELGELPPSVMAEMLKNADSMGEVGAFFREAFGPFDFAGVTLTPPTETFEGSQVRRVGDKEVHLIEVGPAHTRGDVIVHVPADGAVFTGDILFIEGHPIIWAGPVGNWIRACDRILELVPEVVVPGHGPLTDARGVRAVRDYLSYIEREARARFDAGMDVAAAARDISLADYSAWGDAERIVVNVATLYREFGAADALEPRTDLFALMAQLRQERRL